MMAGNMRRRAARKERAGAMSDADYKQRITDKFNGRWDVPGYRREIEDLASLWEASRIDEDERETFSSESERIAEEYDQGLGTVVADAARMSMQQRKGRRRAARTALGFTSPYSDKERQAISVIADAAKEKLRNNLEPDAPYESESWAYRRLEQELLMLQDVEIAALAVGSGAWASGRDMEDLAFSLAGKMFDKPGYGIGMEKDLF